MSSTTQIATLAKRITDANVAYRNNAPVMSDAAYDALEDELRALDPNHAALAKIGAPVAMGAVKVAHAIPMGSLKKCHFDPDTRAIRDADANRTPWWPGNPVCITHKLDGISVNLVYRDRKLVRAVTRGDGAEGEDITRNVMMMEGAVRILPAGVPSDVNIRGEVICRQSKFAAHFPGESNPRNTAAGKAKSQSGDSSRYLTVVAYQYLPDGVPPSSKATEIDVLEGFGFVTPPHYWANTLEEAIAVYEDYVATKRVKLDWEIDGLVIDIDDRDDREALGVTDQRPKGARALKFPSATAETLLTFIRWQVGKSGRLTPVADFQTVRIAGANISKASLHNLGNICDLAGAAGQQNLAVGDKILVARRNDVIPYVEEVLVPNEDANAVVLEPPTECPDCGTAVIRDGAYLVCPNGDTCPAQISGSIKRWVAKIGVKHFGTSLIDMLCETGTIDTIADLYRLDPVKVSSMGMGGRRVGGTADKAFNNLHAAKTMPLHVFVGSLGIPLIGRSMAQTIVDAGFDSLNKLSAAKVADIAAIPGVGGTKAQAFCDGFWDLLDRGVITSLMAHITIAAKATGAFSGKSVCMTGFRDATMVTAIESQGGTVKSSVSKGLDILVLKDPQSTSGKAEKARKYGTKLVGIDDMWNRLGGKP
jgi:DNA ligase (NAD+)